MEFLDYVNDRDEVIGSAPRSEVYEKRLLHRIVHVLVFNKNRELALQRSSDNKEFCPGHWGTSAGGHVQSGEAYQEAALRELEEELEVTLPLEFMFKDFYEDAQRGLRKILVTFKTSYNGPFLINKNEVQDIHFFSLNKIQEMINDGEKFHTELLFLLEKHFGIKRA